VKLGEGVVTATYSGEIIFWKLETGQPYRRYSVMDPTRFIELKLTAAEEKFMRRSKRMGSTHTDHHDFQTGRATRSVFISLDTGYIQMYSHHQRGGYIMKFLAVHKTGDCVLTMCTDRKNRFLYTGTAFGYIKIWHIVNFW
ncbi:hypothetical protein M5D96_014197, partial [Drosophila gunungcola]